MPGTVFKTLDISLAGLAAFSAMITAVFLLYLLDRVLLPFVPPLTRRSSMRRILTVGIGALFLLGIGSGLIGGLRGVEYVVVGKAVSMG